ncbi:MAG: cyclic nucleotide-binding domain-containing protein [Acidobacteriota bacterium]
MNELHIEDSIDPEWANVFHEPASETYLVEEVLHSVPIFSLLSLNELELLARVVHLRRFSTGETVIRRGMPQSGFYLIQSGSVEIVRDEADGDREVVDILGPGALLGEFALLDDTPRSSSILAAEASELIGFFKPDLMDILDTHPVMGCKILLRLAEEMARSLRQDYGRLRACGYPFGDGEGPSTQPAEMGRS